MNEIDMCRQPVVPQLQPAGWDAEAHSVVEQGSIADGPIVSVGRGFVRRAPTRVDYLLRHARDAALAVVEAKAYRTAGDEFRQVRNHVQTLGLSFCCSTTNSHATVECDLATGQEQVLVAYPTPDDVWQRYGTFAGPTDAGAARRIGGTLL